MSTTTYTDPKWVELVKRKLLQPILLWGVVPLTNYKAEVVRWDTQWALIYREAICIGDGTDIDSFSYFGFKLYEDDIATIDYDRIRKEKFDSITWYYEQKFYNNLQDGRYYWEEDDDSDRR